MDEEKLIGAIFENLPVEMTENILIFMDMGTVLYLCANNDPLNETCTENFWERKVNKTYGKHRIQGTGWDSWRDMALALYLQSLEQEQCFECSQYVPAGEIRQCEECAIDLCSLCGDSEFTLCRDCRDRENELSGGAKYRRYLTNETKETDCLDHGCDCQHKITELYEEKGTG